MKKDYSNNFYNNFENLESVYKNLSSSSSVENILNLMNNGVKACSEDSEHDFSKTFSKENYYFEEDSETSLMKEDRYSKKKKMKIKDNKKKRNLNKSLNYRK